MQAINLIPHEQRRGAGGAAGRSGGAAYVLLGLLAIMVLVVASLTVTKRSVSDKRARVATLEAQAAVAEGRAGELASFVQFAGMRVARTQTVTSLAASRFDWSHALSEIARVIPDDVSLIGMQGTVAPGVALKASAGSAGGALRGALPQPAIELSGCTVDQNAVARMITRMRLVDGVTRVALQSSVKSEAQASASSPGARTSECRQGKPGAAPTFALVVFFDQAAGSVPTAARSTGSLLTTQTPPAGATGATGAAAAPGTGGTP